MHSRMLKPESITTYPIKADLIADIHNTVLSKRDRHIIHKRSESKSLAAKAVMLQKFHIYTCRNYEKTKF